jgi:23S rRNA (cytosine1962-C5)-methyltransferase
MKKVTLKKQEERRVLAGHLWIFSNEIDTKICPLSQFSAGEAVLVEDYRHKFLGIGYINPQSLLCIRLLSSTGGTELNANFFEKQIKTAFKIRERVFSEPYYRLVFSECDFSTAGIQQFQPLILEALISLFSPRSILAHHQLSARKLENLPLENEVLYGQAPPVLSVVENGCSFETPALNGQKTGWFFDHRMNRARLASYVKGKTVLDLFSYVGGWAIPAAKYGATHVTAIDSSELATQFLAKNATKNGVQDQMEILTEDVFKALEKLIAEGKTFDVIVADPPAFIKKKADLKPGIQGYTKLHQLCLKLLKKEGILISASCSLHLSGEELLNIIRQTSVSAVRKTRVLEQLHQGPDHPLHPSIKETAYLKGFVSVVG